MRSSRPDTTRKSTKRRAMQYYTHQIATAACTVKPGQAGLSHGAAAPPSRGQTSADDQDLRTAISDASSLCSALTAIPGLCFPDDAARGAPVAAPAPAAAPPPPAPAAAGAAPPPARCSCGDARGACSACECASAAMTVQGVHMPDGGWFRKCRGCGWLTAHERAISDDDVPFCKRCARGGGAARAVSSHASKQASKQAIRATQPRARASGAPHPAPPPPCASPTARRRLTALHTAGARPPSTPRARPCATGWSRRCSTCTGPGATPACDAAAAPRATPARAPTRVRARARRAARRPARAARRALARRRGRARPVRAPSARCT